MPSRTSLIKPHVWAACAAALLAVSPAWAQKTKEEIIFSAMQDEIQRTVAKLQMENMSKPYFMSALVADMARVQLGGDFGAVVTVSSDAYRMLKIDLRVGDRSLDNTHFVGRDHWTYRPKTAYVPEDDDYDALRFEIWSAADEAYKSALELFSQKTAYLKSKLIADRTDDLSVATPVAEILPEYRENLDVPLWTAQIRELSKIFKEFAAIQDSYVSMDFLSRNDYFTSSEGARWRKPAPEVEIRLSATVQAADGMKIHDSRLLLARSLQDIPDFEALKSLTRDFAANMAELSKAPPMESYIGPVIFEEQAAAEFFNQLLARNVSFPKSPLFENESKKEDFQSAELLRRLNRRVVPEFISAADDPSLTEYGGSPLAGHYLIDDEGVKAQRVEIVVLGKLKDVLMDRSPIKERAQSNGHGRAGLTELPGGRIGNFIVTAAKTLSREKLKEKLLELCRKSELEYGLIIRRMERETARKAPGSMLSDPVAAYKVYAADGREEPVRGL
ncbi:MAG: hypothetical protein HY611_06815, partial [Elusimicrobia bacterium]|nr:hypothetical protein [Elusimicrobiota bacterium]